mmetsp:Transcript_4813/g.11485  ORF Transcript_4813/g.11485 Transcript_4813/m.11485 type:complete len:249 (+) Transcript_4813:134-880(+)
MMLCQLSFCLSFALHHAYKLDKLFGELDRCCYPDNTIFIFVQRRRRKIICGRFRFGNFILFLFPFMSTSYCVEVGMGNIDLVRAEHQTGTIISRLLLFLELGILWQKIFFDKIRAVHRISHHGSLVQPSHGTAQLMIASCLGFHFNNGNRDIDSMNCIVLLAAVLDWDRAIVRPNHSPPCPSSLVVERAIREIPACMIIFEVILITIILGTQSLHLHARLCETTRHSHFFLIVHGNIGIVLTKKRWNR